jgi:hypothetical protein
MSADGVIQPGEKNSPRLLRKSIAMPLIAERNIFRPCCTKARGHLVVEHAGLEGPVIVAADLRFLEVGGDEGRIRVSLPGDLDEIGAQVYARIVDIDAVTAEVLVEVAETTAHVEHWAALGHDGGQHRNRASVSGITGLRVVAVSAGSWK